MLFYFFFSRSFGESHSINTIILISKWILLSFLLLLLWLLSGKCEYENLFFFFKLYITISYHQISMHHSIASRNSKLFETIREKQKRPLLTYQINLVKEQRLHSQSAFERFGEEDKICTEEENISQFKSFILILHLMPAN